MTAPEQGRGERSAWFPAWAPTRFPRWALVSRPRLRWHRRMPLMSTIAASFAWSAWVALAGMLAVLGGIWMLLVYTALACWWAVYGTLTAYALLARTGVRMGWWGAGQAADRRA